MPAGFFEEKRGGTTGVGRARGEDAVWEIIVNGARGRGSPVIRSLTGEGTGTQKPRTLKKPGKDG